MLMPDQRIMYTLTRCHAPEGNCSDEYDISYNTCIYTYVCIPIHYRSALPTIDVIGQTKPQDITTEFAYNKVTSDLDLCASDTIFSSSESIQGNNRMN